MKVFVVLYNGLDWDCHIERVFTTETLAEEYIRDNGGMHSEIHRYQIEEHEVENGTES